MFLFSRYFKNEKYRKAALQRIASSPSCLLTVLAYMYRDTYMYLNTTMKKMSSIYSLFIKSSGLHFGMTYQGGSHHSAQQRTEDRHCFRLTL